MTVDAAGDGDFTDIPSAVAALADGGHIFVGPGIYPMAGLNGGVQPEIPDGVPTGNACVWLPSNLTIEGSGPGVTIIEGKRSRKRMQIFGAWGQEYIKLSNFTLKDGGVRGRGIALFWCRDCLVQDVEVVSSSDTQRGGLTGISDYGLRNQFVRCRVDSQKAGYELGYGDQGTVLENCVASNNSMAGIAFDTWTTLPGAGWGPNQWPPTPGNRDLRITGCRIANNGVAGINLTAFVSAVITGCTFCSNENFDLVAAGAPNKSRLAPSAIPSGFEDMNLVCQGLIFEPNDRLHPGIGAHLLLGADLTVHPQLPMNAVIANCIFKGGSESPAPAAISLLNVSSVTMTGLLFSNAEVCISDRTPASEVDPGSCNGPAQGAVIGCFRDRTTQAGLYSNGPTRLDASGSVCF